MNELKQITNLLSRGCNSKQVSHRLNVTMHHVRYVLKKHNINIKEAENLQNQQIQDLYNHLNSGKSFANWCKINDFSKDHIVKILHQKGIQITPGYYQETFEKYLGNVKK